MASVIRVLTPNQVGARTLALQRARDAGHHLTLLYRVCIVLSTGAQVMLG